MAILVVYLLTAGVAILIASASESKHAVAYGASWEARVKGFAGGALTPLGN